MPTPKAHLSERERGTILARRLALLGKKLGIRPFGANAFRHTYIRVPGTGVNANVVAKLVGNSPRTIAKFYDHCNQRTTELKEAAKKAVQ